MHSPIPAWYKERNRKITKELRKIPSLQTFNATVKWDKTYHIIKIITTIMKICKFSFSNVCFTIFCWLGNQWWNYFQKIICHFHWFFVRPLNEWTNAVQLVKWICQIIKWESRSWKVNFQLYRLGGRKPKTMSSVWFNSSYGFLFFQHAIRWDCRMCFSCCLFVVIFGWKLSKNPIKSDRFSTSWLLLWLHRV